MALNISGIQSSKGVSRNLTHAFKSFRKESKNKTSRFKLDLDSTEDTGSQKLLQDQVSIPLSLPPLWVDSFEVISEKLQKIQDSLNLLGKAQKQRLAITFGETKQKETEIKALSDKITEMIRFAEKEIKEITKFQGNPEDSTIRKNITQSLAQRLQTLTSTFRKLQQHYMSSLSSFETDNLLEEPQESILDLQEEESVVAYNVLAERDSAINQLVDNLNELGTIFKELANLVVHQGTILDRIDYNIEQTLENTQKGEQELIKAEKHQKCTRATSCILFLIFGIFMLIIMLVLKHAV